MNSRANSPEDRIALAKAMEERGEYAEALELWRELAANSSDAAILCQQGRLARELGFVEESEQAYRAAIRAESSLSWGYVGLAMLLEDRGDLSEAVELFAKASRLERSASIFTLLGAALVDLDRIEEAIESFETALRIDPSYEEAYFNLAILKKRQIRRKVRLFFQRRSNSIPTTPGHTVNWVGY